MKTALLILAATLHLAAQTHFDQPTVPVPSEKPFFQAMTELDWPSIEKQAAKLRKYRGAVLVYEKDFPGEFARGFFTGALLGTEVKKPKACLYMLTPRVQLVDEVARSLKLVEPFDRENLAKKYAGANTFYLAVDATGKREAFMDDLLGMRSRREATPIEKIYLKTSTGPIQPLKVDGDRFYFPLNIIPHNRWHRVYAVVVDKDGASVEIDISGQVMANNDML